MPLKALETLLLPVNFKLSITESPLSEMSQIDNIKISETDFLMLSKQVKMNKLMSTERQKLLLKMVKNITLTTPNNVEDLELKELQQNN